MTRTEFDENITTWWDLIDFCNEHNIYVCEDVYSADSAVELVKNILHDDGISGVCWFLSDVGDRDAEFFKYTDNGLFSLDEGDFDDMKDEVANEYDDDFGFDEEPEEDRFDDDFDEETEEEDEPEAVEEEMFLEILIAK